MGTSIGKEKEMVSRVTRLSWKSSVTSSACKRSAHLQAEYIAERMSCNASVGSSPQQKGVWHKLELRSEG